MSYRVVCTSVLAGMTLTAALGQAQAIVASNTFLATEQAQVRSGRDLDTRISIHLVQVPLDSALQLIASQASLTATFGPVISRDTRRITVRGEQSPVREVLDRALSGTGLTYSMSGKLLVFERAKPAALAQGTIVGKVINAKTRQPIAGASVTLGDESKSVTTSADGTFRIQAPPGDHTLRIRAVGMTRQAKQVSVQEGANVSVDVAMEPSASVLDEVVVTGTVVANARKEIATPITVISGDELEKRGITRIEQLFRGEVPGLLVLEQGAAAYSTQDVGQGVRSKMYSRGSASLDGSANPIKTYVDGVELVDPSYLGTIDPRSIEKIEIVTGPQAATIYGSGAMGGVMQIFTKRGLAGAAPEVTLALKYGMLQNNFSNGVTPAHNDAITVRGGASRDLTYSGSLSYDYTGQWQPKLYSGRYGASLGATHTRDRVTVSAAFSASASRQGTWAYGFSGDYGHLQLLTGPEACYENLPGKCEDVGAYFNSQQVSLSSNQIVSLNVDVQATPVWQHHVTLGKSQNIMNLKPLAPNFSFGNEFGADTLFMVRRVNGQRLTWNYNTSYVTSWSMLSSAFTVGANGSMGDQVSIQGGQVSASATTVVGWNGTGGASVTLPMNDQNWGAFGNWRIGLFNQLYTTVGLRVEQNPRYGREVKFDLTPTNGLTYTIERGPVSVKLMGSYGRATRPPLSDQRLERMTTSTAYTIGTYVSRFANAELRPEYSRGPQGGIEVYIGNLASVTVNHYQQTVTDLIQQVPVDSFLATRISNGVEQWVRQTQFQNIAKVRQMGWEGTAALQIGPVSMKGAYSWSESKILSLNPRGSNQFYAAGQSFYNLPTHSANVSLGYARGLTNLMLVTNYVGQGIWHNSSDLMYWQIYQAKYPMYAALADYGRLHYYRTHPGYAKADLVGSRRITPQLTVTLNVINVGNGFESDISELNPSLGRQTTLGISYRFGRK